MFFVLTAARRLGVLCIMAASVLNVSNSVFAFRSCSVVKKLLGTAPSGNRLTVSTKNVAVNENRNKSWGFSSSLVLYASSSAFREPAGVESLFSIPTTARRTKRKSKWRRLLRGAIGRVKRNNCSDSTDNDDDEFCWDDNHDDVLATQRQLNLPAWACVDNKEKQRLAAMKFLLKDDLKKLVEPKSITNSRSGDKQKAMHAFPDAYGDFRLLRFLRKDKYQDPISAAVRYRNFLHWRDENNVDDRVRVAVEDAPFDPPQHLNVVSKYIKCDFNVATNSTEDGETIPALLPVGDWDTVGITNLMKRGELSLDDFLQYWTYMYESLHVKLYDESMKRKKMVYIDEVCDLTTSHLGQVSPGFLSKVIQPWVKLTQSNYPETAKHICFLNPPKILSLGWALVAPLISPSTVEKIRLHPNFDGDCYDFVENTNDANRGGGAVL